MNASRKNKALLSLTTRVVIGGLSSLLPWQAALAQTANNAPPEAASNSGILQEVVVTARKQAENIQRVPISITAISGEQLKVESVKTVSNLQNVTPGLFVQQALDDPQSLAITMRGRKQDDASMAVDPSIAMSVDGLYNPRTIGMSGSMLDINRVEVLRGPQGTLDGRNSTGGAINIYTNDPTDELSGSVDVTGGDYETWNVVGIANIPLTDNLAARFVAQDGGNGGYNHFSNGQSLGAQRTEYYRGKLKWTGGHNWQAVLSGHYEHDRSNNDRWYFVGLDPANFEGNGLPLGGYLTQEVEGERGISEAQAVSLLQSWTALKTPWYTQLNPDAIPFMSDVERWDVGLNISGDLTDDVQFRSITGVQGLRRTSAGDLPPAIIYLREFPRSTGQYYSQEFQLLGKASTLKWVVGAYGGYETGTDEQTVFTLPVAFGSTAGGENNNGIRNTTAAAFAQGTWEFVPDWHLTAGARYTRDTREVTANSYNVDMVDPTIQQCVVPALGYQIGDPTNPASTQCGREFKASFSQPTWLVSLDHQLTTDVLVYAKVATGYRSGGLNADSGTNELVTYAAFAPETNMEYETGFKSRFLDRVRLNADVYWDHYSNMQVQEQLIAPDGSFQSIETNAATARIRGGEVEADIIIGEGLSLHASTAYTDAQYLHYVDVVGNHAGQPFSVPKWTYTLGANYTHPTGVGDASLQCDWAWKSAVDVGPTATPAFAALETQPGYGLLNARLNLHLDAWNTDIAVFGQNLTNKFYFDQGGSINGPGYDFSVAYVGSTPRTLGVELIKKFGE